MVKRMILMLGIAAIVVVGLGFVKFKQFQIAAAHAAAFQPPPEAVTTIIAKRTTWPATINAIGTVTAVQGVTVSADLPGVVARINFDSGKTVHAGDVLVELDTRQEQAQLASAVAQHELARLNYDRLKGLVEEGAIAKADYDRAVSEQKTTAAGTGEIRATIERKTIRAPFTGILGIRQVNLGQYLAAGGPVVSLQSMDPIYVVFGVPQQQAGEARPGRQIRVTTTGETTHATLSGAITAIDSTVDPATRNLQVQATLANPKGILRPGMFVETEVRLGTGQTVVELPASAISYAPYGNSVFVVTQMKDKSGAAYKGVRQQFVTVAGSRGDQVATVSGVNPGDEVVTSGAFKLRNGAAVVINNKVRPANSPAPKPEDS